MMMRLPAISCARQTTDIFELSVIIQMSTIDWYGGFNRISWAHEAGRLVVAPVFEDYDMAVNVSERINRWNDRFVKLTIIESDTEYAVCCYQDPTVDRDDVGMGMYRSGLPRIAGYEQAKQFFLAKSPLFQIAYAADYARLETYRQASRLIYPSRCRIITVQNMKRQEYYYERLASESDVSHRARRK